MNDTKPSNNYQRRTRKEWQELVDAFEQTDQSTAQFCQQRQLSYQSFNLKTAVDKGCAVSNLKCITA